MRLGLGIGLKYGGKGGGGAAPTGLLDSYTGAAVAFSLDTLIYGSHSVTDNEVGSQTNGQTDAFTVRVRRSSDNAVKSFTYEELSDGTLVTWVGAGNDGFVEAWYDQSGNDYHAERSTAAEQPKIVDAGSLVVESGNAALDFDGTDDSLVINFSARNAQPNTIFSVFKANAVSNFDLFGSTDISYRTLIDVAAGNWRAFSGSALASGISLTTDAELIYALFSGSSSEIQVSSNALVSGDAGTSDMNDKQLIAASPTPGYFNGLVLNLTVYTSDESSDRVAIKTALNNYYNIY